MLSFFGGGVWALLRKSSTWERGVLPWASIVVTGAATAAVATAMVECH